jgi:hypothetical protein
VNVVPDIRGIDGLTAREPIGCCLSIGRKGDRGAPVDNDRFYFVVPNEVDGVRPLHPAFAAFNNEKPEHRTIIRGHIVHVDVDAAFSYSLKAQVLQGYPPHPAKAPTCIGNGHAAKRWIDGEYQDIPCPNEKCPFRQPTMVNGKSGPTPCKPFGRLLFRPRWKEGSTLPSLLTKWTTGSWNSVASLHGLFEHVRTQAEQLHLESFSVYGLPFMLTLSRKKRRGEGGASGRAFPVVSASVDGDVVEFLYNQKLRLAELGGSAPLLVALTDDEQRTAKALLEDTKGIVVDVDLPGGGGE